MTLFGKAMKRLTRHRNKILPLQQENGLLAVTDKVKANILASQLAETFQHHLCTVPENNSFVEIQQFLSALLPVATCKTHLSWQNSVNN